MKSVIEVPLVTEEQVERLIDEGAVPLKELCKLVPGREGSTAKVDTLVGWHRQGERGVRLEAFKLRGLWVSSRKAVARYLAAVNGSVAGAVPDQAKKDERERRHRAAEADKRIAELRKLRPKG